MRFVLVDRVTALQPGESARGVKCVTLSEDFSRDHFPELPVFPGVLMVEALAQLGGFLLEVSLNTRGQPLRRALLAQIDRARFVHPAWAGDQLDLRVKTVATLDAAARIDGEVFVRDTLVARATLTFMLRTLEVEPVHEHRRALYRTWTRGLDPLPEIL